MKNLKNKKGFTLAELLIVVAIIAVLVAIAIPVFTKRLEQSRETTDIANMRSAYAAGQVAALAGIGGKKVSATATYYYDPNADEGLTTTKASGVKGQGTATDGQTAIENLPSQIKYQNSVDVRSQVIKVTFNSVGLNEVTFAS